MHILLTNDDGIHAPGLWEAAKALRPLGRVIVCAPDREQSGVGGSMTLQLPVRLTTFPSLVEGVEAYTVEGTPADAVVVAMEVVLERPPDLVVSGINQGANLGEDVLLSGTVGGALQGWFRGIPSIAVSLCTLTNFIFGPSALVVRLLAQQAAEGALPRPILLNVNLPNLPLEKLEGVEITRLGRRSYAEVVRQGDDGRRKWYWIARSRPVWEVVEGTDVWAVRHHRVSITPLTTDLTHYSLLPSLAGLAKALAEGIRPPRNDTP
ncbi:MAG: 5'/3'-nucleotidase SurE [Dehalococcoidia bacterium]|nr:5'/3'-nucleotidase SurE [Dehalococcoidia bacterium]MDW8119995.1 5'/3'-nucleotidase SurE [Chloroflexota bacterium]